MLKMRKRFYPYNNYRRLKDVRKCKNHNWIPEELYIKIKRRTKVCESKKCKTPDKILTWNQKRIHHIIPVSKGGTDDPKNLMVCCKKCHKKEDKEAGV